MAGKLARIELIDGKIMVELPPAHGLRVGSFVEIHQEGPSLRIVPRDATRELSSLERQALMARIVEETPADPDKQKIVDSRREAQTPPPGE